MNDRPGGAPSGHCVLIVDDVEDNRDMYAEYFAMKGYRVVAARDGHEGITHAQAQRPDVILLDLRMPGLTGEATLRLLRSDATFAEVPIIAVTAHAFVDERAKALAAGFDRFVSKPCLPDELVRIVEEVLQERRRVTE
jgi:two-component system cell cycle response regulator DivK